MGEHTPTPWRIEVVESSSSGDPVELIVCGTDWEIAQIELGEEDNLCRANAAFIVKACNSHDALVKALEAIRDCAKNTRDWQELEQCRTIAREALAKVRP